MGDNYYVLTPISYYFFANTILKCAAFPFLTPARKPPQIFIKNSIFRNSLIFQGLPPIKYQNLMYFPLFLPL